MILLGDLIEHLVQGLEGVLVNVCHHGFPSHLHSFKLILQIGIQFLQYLEVFGVGIRVIVKKFIDLLRFFVTMAFE